MELSHLTLDTGIRLRCSPDSVSDDLLADVHDWLLDLVWSQREQALPARWPGYRANATDFGGGLVLTLYADGDEAPVLTVGVARRASHGNPLWRVLTALPRALPGLPAPRTPWCGVLDHRSESAAQALQEFIRACAWVWVQRPLPQRRSGQRPVISVRAGSGSDDA